MLSQDGKPRRGSFPMLLSAPFQESFSDSIEGVGNETLRIEVRSVHIEVLENLVRLFLY